MQNPSLSTKNLYFTIFICICRWHFLGEILNWHYTCIYADNLSAFYTRHVYSSGQHYVGWKLTHDHIKVHSWKIFLPVLSPERNLAGMISMYLYIYIYKLMILFNKCTGSLLCHNHTQKMYISRQVLIRIVNFQIYAQSNKTFLIYFVNLPRQGYYRDMWIIKRCERKTLNPC